MYVVLEIIMQVLLVVIFGIAALGGISAVFAQTIQQTMEGSMDVEIMYPVEVLVGRDAVISILIKNNGWEDKQDIHFEFSSNDGKLMAVPAEITVEKISKGGSHGSSIDVFVAADTNPGTSFLNVRYSQTLVANNETPQDPIFSDIAIPITLKELPEVAIYTKAPESIFASAEFPLEVEVTSHDVDIRDVNISIIPPDDVGFRGETLHTFSIIKKGESVTASSRIVTPPQEINTEYRIPFGVVVKYVDDVGEEMIDSETISLVMRPRVFMELTTEGGLWVGDFFIAPYVSLGTIIGIPTGALITLLIRQKTTQRKRKPKRRK